ncbi:hypothetical protein HX109_09565 [Galbibacter sp. BG1]|uniref:hypothetical protein n=1 Tax=Galbibacter sp. BG1 TaxID=1170699 RepID=UPI0015BE712E|nr:hypothetical protein [Galbibacter sp. BG1]QLE01791.1 hypothetical protein HX109_09565 [Galbibacter sp. BG1]
MSRNPLDEDIKNRLENRRIATSSNAWQKLEAKLDMPNNEAKTKSRPINWVAASILLLFATGTYVFFNAEENVSAVVVKDRDKKMEPEGVNKLPETFENKEGGVTEKSTKKEFVKQNSTKEAPVKTKEAITDGVEIVQNESMKKEDFETQKINEVASQIIELKQNETVTDEEIEALLLAAQKSIYKERINKKSPDSLSAMALLEEVETELDQSFKEKVFEAIKEGFVKVKTAVAERNQ